MAGVNQPASNNAKQTPVFKDVKYYLIGPVEDKVRVGVPVRLYVRPSGFAFFFIRTATLEWKARETESFLHTAILHLQV